jgi:hypothetical protein
MVYRIRRDHFDSTHLFKEMSLMESEVTIKVLKGLEWFNTNNINAVIIGGAAVCQYLEERTLTPDIDFLTDDIDSIKDKLGRDEISYTKLASCGGKPLGISIPSFEIDLLDSNSGNKELNKYLLRKGYQITLIAGYIMKIISPEALCIMKLSISGREKDEKDAFALLQSRVLNRTAYLKIIDDLRNSLKDSETLKAYSGMIKQLNP